MFERHYDDEALISLLESNRAGADLHLPSCPPCTEKLDSFRLIADALRDPDVWDTRDVRTDPVPATIATLRAFADRMTDEDSRAEVLLEELLAGPRETWMPRLAEHPEWRTPGVVRKLIDAGRRAIDTMPPDAVEMTALATDIAEHLVPSELPSDTVARLRAAAWRERSFALYYTGQFVDALAATVRSEQNLRGSLVNEYDLARVGIVRTLVLRALERFGEASETAAASASAFATFGDLERLASARTAEVHVLFSRRDFRKAAAILESLEHSLRKSDHAFTHGMVLANLGYCWREIGEYDRAILFYDMAAALFAELGSPTEALRIQWNTAVLTIKAGRTVEGLSRLETARNGFESFGMTSEVAFVSLDMAELLLAQGRFGQVETICRRAIEVFSQSGMPHSTKAMTAFAFMREAADQAKASQEHVRTVREYIRRLPAEPSLLFAPPPLA